MSITASQNEFAQLKSWLDRLKANSPQVQDRETEILPGLRLDQLATLLAGQGPPPSHPMLDAYQAFLEQARAQLLTPELEPVQPRMRAWRRRQMNRLAFQVGSLRAAQICHYSTTFELSSGCSVGCWFCGVSAAKLSRHWPYDQANGHLWRELLSRLQSWVGPALRWSFCYWATDPLDNPDYERFAADFESILGRFPSITTALSLKDPERTRQLLRHARTHPSNGVHFSLLSLKQFERVQALFSPEELLGVDLVPQFAGSTYRMAYAGKARHREREARHDSNPNTIACVSGFLINLVDNSLQIITPCAADEKYPNGYQTYVETTLEANLDELAERFFRLEVRELPRLQWAHSLSAARTAEGLCVAGAGESRTFQHPLFYAVAELIEEAVHSPQQVELLLSFQGYSEKNIQAVLGSLFQLGLLEENL